jgi:hypothetical protein
MNEPELNTEDPNASDEASRVLANLQQMHPQYLACLLRNGELGKLIRRRVDWYRRTMARLQEAFPDESYANLDEKARDCLGGMNPNWRNEMPLTPEEEALLAEFRAQLSGRSDRAPTRERIHRQR